MTRKILKTIPFALAVMILAIPLRAVAQTSTFLTVPNNAEEALTWCGAAAGQSIMGGYPTGACPGLIQTDVWDAIQLNKVESTWDTDPAGLRAALTTLCPLPPGGGWSIFAQPTETALMYWVAHWMARNRFPVALLLDTATHHGAVPTHPENWVTIKGIVTDVDPLTNSSVNLQYVLLYSQKSALDVTADERFLSGSAFYTEFQAVSIPGSAYNGMFVAIIEPPNRRGIAVAKTLPLTGRLIAIDRARAAAARALASTLSRVPTFREQGDLRPQTPLLVNPERGGYYLVPFGKTESSPPTLAILINAYNGEFMEAARLQPRKFIDEREALYRARRFLDTKAGQPKITLVRDQDSPYSPSYRISSGDREIVVDAEGNVRTSDRRRR